LFKLAIFVRKPLNGFALSDNSLWELNREVLLNLTCYSHSPLIKKYPVKAIKIQFWLNVK